jgi:hypothetical protein
MTDQEKVIAGKPVGTSIRDELHKVPGTPFVDFNPGLSESEILRYLSAPFNNVAGKIDGELAKLSSRITALEQRSPFRSCADIET